MSTLKTRKKIENLGKGNLATLGNSCNIKTCFIFKPHRDFPFFFEYRDVNFLIHESHKEMKN